MSSTKRDLYDMHLNEMVAVMTSTAMPQNTEEGIVEMPLLIEGLLIDYDDEKILLEKKNGAGTILICRDVISTIESMDDAQEEMLNPFKPHKNEMN